MFLFAEKFELEHDHRGYISVFLDSLVTKKQSDICLTVFKVFKAWSAEFREFGEFNWRRVRTELVSNSLVSVYGVALTQGM